MGAHALSTSYGHYGSRRAVSPPADSQEKWVINSGDGRPRGVPPRRVLPIPSGLLFPEVRVQNDPVMRLARFQTCEGFVNLAHGEMLGYGRDLVLRSKVEHSLDGHG